MVLALAFAVKLFPPFSEVVELGIVVYEDLNLLSGLIKGVTCGCI